MSALPTKATRVILQTVARGTRLVRTLTPAQQPATEIAR